MKMNYAYLSDRGLTRENNEDYILINEEIALFLLADGMGGHLAGEIASEDACHFIADYVADRRDMLEDDPKALFYEAIVEANYHILEKSRNNPVLSGMGTTIVLLYFNNGEYILSHVGDSRAYLYSGGELSKLTKDHSLVQDMMDGGILSESEAKEHKYRNVITKSLGMPQSPSPEFTEGTIKPGEIILMCTDGLHDYVDMDKIRDYIRDVGPGEAAESAIDLANENGGVDNCSVIFVWPDEQ